MPGNKKPLKFPKDSQNDNSKPLIDAKPEINKIQGLI